MNENDVGVSSSGLNPNYRPPHMRWNKVEVQAAEGTEFGILLDEYGWLSLAVKAPGQPWPCEEPKHGRNTILPGHKCYQVQNDARVSMTAEEADAAYDAADPVPISDDEIKEMVRDITSPVDEMRLALMRVRAENKTLQAELDNVRVQLASEGQCGTEHLIAIAMIGKNTTVIGKGRLRLLHEAEQERDKAFAVLAGWLDQRPGLIRESNRGPDWPQILSGLLERSEDLIGCKEETGG